MNTEKVSVKTILGYLPDSLLENLSIEHGIDKQVKKLEGKLVFKLFYLLPKVDVRCINIFFVFEYITSAGICFHYISVKCCCKQIIVGSNIAHLHTCFYFTIQLFYLPGIICFDGINIYAQADGKIVSSLDGHFGFPTFVKMREKNFH